MNNSLILNEHNKDKHIILEKHWIFNTWSIVENLNDIETHNEIKLINKKDEIILLEVLNNQTQVEIVYPVFNYYETVRVNNFIDEYNENFDYQLIK